MLYLTRAQQYIRRHVNFDLRHASSVINSQSSIWSNRAAIVFVVRPSQSQTRIQTRIQTRKCTTSCARYQSTNPRSAGPFKPSSNNSVIGNVNTATTGDRQRNKQCYLTRRSSSTSSSSSARTSSHNSLTSFLQYAKDKSLNQASTTYQGTLYEYLTQTHLTKHLGFNLTRTGGRGDSGIDLLGEWSLPLVLSRQNQYPGSSSPQGIRVFIQCKNLSSSFSSPSKSKSKPSPSLIRELEGSFLSLPSQTYRSEPSTLGILVCSRPATKGIRDAMGRSNRGLAWLCLEQEQKEEGEIGTNSKRRGKEDKIDHDTKETGLEHGAATDDGDADQVGNTGRIPQVRIRQFLWNQAASERCGLQGLNVGLKHGADNSQRTINKEAILLWQGIPVDFGS